MKVILFASLIIILCFPVSRTMGQVTNLSPSISFKTKVIKDSLFIPWEIIYGPDDHIWFTQKNGYICRMDTAGNRLDTLYHEPNTVVAKEAGMLGMALHPDFINHPYVYVAWEYQDTSLRVWERVERYTYLPQFNRLTAPFVLIDSLTGWYHHNGCRVYIIEDKIFISVADAADSSRPQNLGSYNGKILRLNLDGSVPADNPLAGSPIWTWGHRNPQGLVYTHGKLFSSEHGPDTDDEINIIEKGKNYGWPFVRGFCDKPWEMTFCADSPVTPPLHAWTPTVAPCGIDYYNNEMFPALQNSLLLTTLKDMHLYQLSLNDAFDSITDIAIIDSFNFGRLRDICISPEGKIFISTSNSSASDTGKRIDRIVMLYDPAYPQRKQQLVIYPNPTRDNISISIPAAYNSVSYTIINSEGRRMVQEANLTGKLSINTSLYPAGVYHILLETDDRKRYNGNFVKLR